MPILITVLDLEREPLEFSETIPPGAIDYGSGIRQIDGMSVSGRADLITEHRGGHNVIEDIRLRAGYQGDFEMPCARCLDPVAQRLEEHFDLLFRPAGVDAPTPKSGTMKVAVLRWKTSCASRCCFPCRRERSAGKTARDSALAVDGTSILRPVLAMQAKSMRGGQRWPISAAG
jgi:hypothetical protein